METVVKSTQETAQLARDFVNKELAEKSSRAKIITLIGELGSGKTTFVQEIARALGIEETVISPTFVIERVYKIPKGEHPFKHLAHIDAYRLESSDELATLGWDELIKDPHTLLFIEWAERVESAVPNDAIEITFSTLDENTRKITII